MHFENLVRKNACQVVLPTFTNFFGNKDMGENGGCKKGL